MSDDEFRQANFGTDEFRQANFGKGFPDVNVGERSPDVKVEVHEGVNSRGLVVSTGLRQEDMPSDEEIREEMANLWNISSPRSRTRLDQQTEEERYEFCKQLIADQARWMREYEENIKEVQQQDDEENIEEVQQQDDEENDRTKPKTPKKGKVRPGRRGGRC